MRSCYCSVAALAAALAVCSIPLATSFGVHSRTSFKMSLYENSNYSRGKTNVIAGATGYIGKNVVRESVRQGYKTVALVRDIDMVKSEEGQSQFGNFFKGATIVECDVSDPAELMKTLNEVKAENGSIESVISCLASRSGIKKEAFAIDFQATLNCLDSGRRVGARHFILLSAFCVKKPLLQLQKAKLKFETALRQQTEMTWTIVRPTAFFKSVSNQLEVVQSGSPYVLFGNGEASRCNPISEPDLATYMIDSITDKSRENKIINLGGPDGPITQKMQAQMLYKAVGKEPQYVSAPLFLFDVIINFFQFGANLLKNDGLENAAELARIIKYYAIEDMLTTDPEEKFGTMTLQEHYNKIAVEGQEYDPFVTMVEKSEAPAPKTEAWRQKVQMYMEL